jgi:hypothetical protein
VSAPSLSLFPSSLSSRPLPLPTLPTPSHRCGLPRRRLDETHDIVFFFSHLDVLFSLDMTSFRSIESDNDFFNRLLGTTPTSHDSSTSKYEPGPFDVTDDMASEVEAWIQAAPQAAPTPSPCPSTGFGPLAPAPLQRQTSTVAPDGTSQVQHWIRTGLGPTPVLDKYNRRKFVSSPPLVSDALAASSPALQWEANRSLCTIAQLSPAIRSQCLRVDRLFVACRELLVSGGRYRAPSRTEECICDPAARSNHPMPDGGGGSSNSDTRPLMRLKFHSTEHDLRSLFVSERLPIVCATTDMIQNDTAIFLGDGVVVWRIERKGTDFIPSVHSHLLRSEMKTMELSSHRMCRTALLIESPVEWNESDAHRAAFVGPTESEYDCRYQEARSIHNRNIHFRRTTSIVDTAMRLLLDVYVMLKDGCYYYDQMIARPRVDPCLGYAGPTDPESLADEYLAHALEYSKRKYKPGDLCRTPSAVLVKMLQRIYGVSEEMSRGVQHAYPSLRILWEAYERCKDEQDRLEMLGNVPYRPSGSKREKKVGKKNAQHIFQALYSDAAPALYRAMLECVPGVGSETSPAIQRAYASPNELLRAFGSAPSPETLLETHIKKDVARQVYESWCGPTRSLVETRKLKKQAYQKEVKGKTSTTGSVDSTKAIAPKSMAKTVREKKATKKRKSPETSQKENGQASNKKKSRSISPDSGEDAVVDSPRPVVTQRKKRVPLPLCESVPEKERARKKVSKSTRPISGSTKTFAKRLATQRKPLVMFESE